MAVRADDVDLGRDRGLVERFQSGDAAGFEDLYRRYYSRLYRFCLKRVGDAAEAEEVTQEAFTRAFSALDRLSGERKFYPWLSVIAARLCVDTHRRRSRSQPSDEIDLGMVDGGQEDVIAAVDRELVTEALGRLGPRHREVLRLREEEGWSYQKIAEYYEVSLGTVEQLLWRARRALKREFVAVAGPEGGLAAAIPVFGWVLRRLHSLRARVGDWAAQAAVPLASNAVSLAVVAGSVAAVGVIGGTEPSVSTDGGPEPTPVVVWGTNSAVVEEAPPTEAPKAVTEASPPASEPPPAVSPTAPGPAVTVDADRGFRNSNPDSVRHDNPLFGAELTPSTAERELENFVGDLLEDK